jgi:hypothetical protein
MTCSRARFFWSALLSAMTIAGCASNNPAAPAATTSAPAATTSSDDIADLAGRVFDVTSTGIVPAGGIPLSAVVVPAQCDGACGRTSSFRQFDTVSGPDGSYQFTGLPPGSAAVFPRSPLFRPVCGAGADLRRGTRLDLHITSIASPQGSPFLTPLEISGQVFETTPAGRVGVSGAMIRVDHHVPDAQFIDAVTDGSGFFSICGIPSRWPIGFGARKAGFQRRYTWQEFGGNTRLDIELLRANP